MGRIGSKPSKMGGWVLTSLKVELADAVGQGRFGLIFVNVRVKTSVRVVQTIF